MALINGFGNTDACLLEDPYIFYLSVIPVFQDDGFGISARFNCAVGSHHGNAPVLSRREVAEGSGGAGIYYPDYSDIQPCLLQESLHSIQCKGSGSVAGNN